MWSLACEVNSFETRRSICFRTQGVSLFEFIPRTLSSRYEMKLERFIAEVLAIRQGTSGKWYNKLATIAFLYRPRSYDDRCKNTDSFNHEIVHYQVAIVLIQSSIIDHQSQNGSKSFYYFRRLELLTRSKFCQTMIN
jgi:hypothetical protein